MLCRDGVYYFVRLIPVDMQEHYDKYPLYFSLRTQSKIRTVRVTQSITHRIFANIILNYSRCMIRGSGVLHCVLRSLAKATQVMNWNLM